MEYISDKPYTSENEPQINGCIFRNAVPAYWEDMANEFRETYLYQRFKWNPDYTNQKYPMGGYVPDMALPNIYGCFVYCREFDLDDIPDARYAELYIGGVQNRASAWINGVYIGEHTGFSTPFSFEIPTNILKEMGNKITLAVSNNHLIGLTGFGEPIVSGCTTRAANNYTGGIYGDVEVRFYNDNVRDIFISTDKSLSFFTVHLEARAKTVNDAYVEIYDGNTLVKKEIIKAGEDSVNISTENLEFWSPDLPKRYTAKVTVNGQVFTRKFGIRRLISDGTRLSLNGKYFFARGICEHGYYPLTVHPPRDKSYYRNVIMTLKKLGFNFIRFHTTIPMAEYMEAADELGMIMEVESPNNTTYEEWKLIVKYCRKYTAPVIYSTGNELTIDENYIEHLIKCSKLVHGETDSLFSPMSAMRGIEYHSYGDCKVDEPFPHNPKRLAIMSEFCDLYNSYPNGQLSYFCAEADPENIDRCNAIYKKPLLSHEICINGTYCDLSLKDRYRNSRIGETALFTSVEEHLENKGILQNAPLYYKNSSEWQRRIRKYCFEAARRCETLAGYDYLGDIDHHWHTFGYCVGMMNEFYELKPGETAENVRRYNSDVVVLADIPYNRNSECGQKMEIPIVVSNYGDFIKKATLSIAISANGKVFERRTVHTSEIENGTVKEIYKLVFNMPKSKKPLAIKLTARLAAGEIDAENVWELYAFPKVTGALPTKSHLSSKNLIITEDIDEETLTHAMKNGKKVLLFGNGPFPKIDTSFQIALAGRTAGHLASVIRDSKLMEDFPHEGFCGWQFRKMFAGGAACVIDTPNVPFSPLVEMVGTYKCAHKEALIFEYKVENGSLLVCSLNLSVDDPAARWLKNRIISYAMSEDFTPSISLTEEQLLSLSSQNPVYVAKNTNLAINANDPTM